MPFMETSAKTGLNVELAFLAVARYDLRILILKTKNFFFKELGASLTS